MSNDKLIDLEWIKNDRDKHVIFEEGSVYLIAVPVMNNETKKEYYEYALVQVDCNSDEQIYLTNYNTDESYDDWQWEDVEYFCPIDSPLPTQEAANAER